jgi:hypothetical protein
VERRAAGALDGALETVEALARGVGVVGVGVEQQLGEPALQQVLGAQPPDREVVGQHARVRVLRVVQPQVHHRHARGAHEVAQPRGRQRHVREDPVVARAAEVLQVAGAAGAEGEEAAVEHPVGLAGVARDAGVALVGVEAHGEQHVPLAAARAVAGGARRGRG